MSLGQLAGLARYKNMIISCVANYITIIIIYIFQILCSNYSLQAKKILTEHKAAQMIQTAWQAYRVSSA